MLLMDSPNIRLPTYFTLPHSCIPNPKRSSPTHRIYQDNSNKWKATSLSVLAKGATSSKSKVRVFSNEDVSLITL